jgi:hypothetical protein
MTYMRNGRTSAQEMEIPPMKKQQDAGPKKDSEGVRVNGFQQVIDLLRTADPEFRESLLRRMMRQDPTMASQLQAELKRLDLE